MAMSKKGLSAAIYNKLTTKPLDTNGITGVTIKQTPQSDGTVKTSTEETRGSTYLGKDMAQVIADAVAEAVYEHLTTSAETSSGDTIK